MVRREAPEEQEDEEDGRGHGEQLLASEGPEPQRRRRHASKMAKQILL